MSDLLTIDTLSKKYGRTAAVDSTSLTLGVGRIVGLIGENGAGKTSLLQLIADLAKPSGGSICIAGIPAGQQTHLLVSFMPDHNNLFKWMKVKTIIAWYKDMFSDFDAGRAKTLCKQMEIDLDSRIMVLSKGIAERLMLILTLSRKTSVYLLDEPLTGIDPLAKCSMIEIIRETQTESNLILISSHFLNDMEELFDEVVFMKDGKLLPAELTDDIRENRALSLKEYYCEVMAK